MKRKQPDWMRDIKVGDVLCSGRGTMRVVRHASFYSNGDLRSVQFIIRRCSWTHRCLTTMNYNDLQYQRYSPTMFHWKMKGPLDNVIAKHVKDHNFQTLDCCAVKGIA